MMVAPKPNVLTTAIEGSQLQGFNFFERRIITKNVRIACSYRISKIFEHTKRNHRKRLTSNEGMLLRIMPNLVSIF